MLEAAVNLHLTLSIGALIPRQGIVVTTDFRAEVPIANILPRLIWLSRYLIADKQGMRE